MKAFLLALLLLVLRPAWADEGEQEWIETPSPNGRYAVRLYIGSALGNCHYNRATLIERKTSKMLHDLGPAEDADSGPGGYDSDSVVWAPDSAYVAVYFRTHRVGVPIILDLTGPKVRQREVPQITLPHDKDPKNAGRHAQDWQKPVKWISKSELRIVNDGVIQQQHQDGRLIMYRYNLILQIRNDGSTVFTSVKLREFTHD